MADALFALNERYRASLPEKRAAIFAAWSDWRSDVSTLASLQELCRLLHKLAGSAGAYGFIRLGESARAADALLHEWLSDAPEALDQRQALTRSIEPLILAIHDLFTEAMESSAPTARVGDADRDQRLQVILVDDDAEMALVLAAQLKHEGIDVLSTASGEGMYQLLRDTKPDVLVLDFWLHEETGDDLARALRADPTLCRLPTVCLTSDRSKETRQRALIAGALEVIDKSTPCAQLAGLLRHYAGRAA